MSSSHAFTLGARLVRVVLALVGAVFVLKYGARVVGVMAASAAAAAYALAYVGLLSRRWANAHLEAPAAIAVVFVAVAVAAVAPETNGLARAPAIDEWLGALAGGAFPYGQPSRPSGLPVLFGLAFPFWWTGAVWMIPPAGLALLFRIVFRVTPPGERLGVVVATAALVPVLYKVWMHSELVANGAVALGAVLVAEALRRRGGAGALVGAAVVVGLALSTRLSVGLVVATYGAFVLRRDAQWALGWGALALAVCAATVVPFALWEPETFRALGPFSTQARFLPSWAMPVAVAGALGLGWTATDVRASVLRSGVLLVGLAALAFALALADYGPGVLWGSGFDVTYLVLGVPLLLATLPPWRESSLSD